ncbi:MAG: hypothetical protein ACPGEG_07125 [Salibacteraceae bacterium]
MDFPRKARNNSFYNNYTPFGNTFQKMEYKLPKADRSLVKWALIETGTPIVKDFSNA